MCNLYNVFRPRPSTREGAHLPKPTRHRRATRSDNAEFKTVALGAPHGGEAWDQVELAGELAGFLGGVGRAIIGQPPDWMRRALGAEAFFDRLQHHVAHVAAADAATRNTYPTDGLAVMGIDNEADTDGLVVPTADLEGIGTSSKVRRPLIRFMK